MNAVVIERSNDAIASARARRLCDIKTALRSVVCCVRRATVRRSDSALFTSFLVTRLIIEVRMSHEMMQLATMIRILSGIPTSV